MSRKKFITYSLILVFFIGGAMGSFYFPAVLSPIGEMIEAIKSSSKMAKLYSKELDAVLLMPVPTIKVKAIGDTWQASRAAGRAHDGQDIFAKNGTPIYSATGGFVIRVGSNDLGGQTVMVLGAGGRRYYYAHLNGYGPDAVMWKEVATTSVIGYVGNTGNASGTPTHLHFGVYASGGPINPLPLLVDR